MKTIKHNSLRYPYRSLHFGIILLLVCSVLHLSSCPVKICTPQYIDSEQSEDGKSEDRENGNPDYWIEQTDGESQNRGMGIRDLGRVPGSSLSPS